MRLTTIAARRRIDGSWTLSASAQKRQSPIYSMRWMATLGQKATAADYSVAASKLSSRHR